MPTLEAGSLSTKRHQTPALTERVLFLLLTCPIPTLFSRSIVVYAGSLDKQKIIRVCLILETYPDGFSKAAYGKENRTTLM